MREEERWGREEKREGGSWLDIMFSWEKGRGRILMEETCLVCKEKGWVLKIYLFLYPYNVSFQNLSMDILIIIIKNVLNIFPLISFQIPLIRGKQKIDLPFFSLITL